MELTANRAMIAFCIVITAQLITSFLSESYAVRKDQINTAVDACLQDYRHHALGSGTHLEGCNKCVGLGISMMNAHGGLIDPIDYHMTIEAKVCRGYKQLKPVMIDLPPNPLRKIPKMALLLALLVFFIPSVPLKKIKSKLRLSKLMRRSNSKVN